MLGVSADLAALSVRLHQRSHPISHLSILQRLEITMRSKFSRYDQMSRHDHDWGQ